MGPQCSRVGDRGLRKEEQKQVKKTQPTQKNATFQSLIEGCRPSQPTAQPSCKWVDEASASGKHAATGVGPGAGQGSPETGGPVQLCPRLLRLSESREVLSRAEPLPVLHSTGGGESRLDRCHRILVQRDRAASDLKHFLLLLLTFHGSLQPTRLGFN